MIAVAPAVKELLLANDAVKALVGTRVYRARMPVRDKLPGPTLVIARAWPIAAQQGGEGATGLEEYRVQLDAYAETPDAADALMVAACACLASSSANPGERVAAGVRLLKISETGGVGAPEDEEDTGIGRRMQSFRISAARAA